MHGGPLYLRTGGMENRPPPIMPTVGTLMAFDGFISYSHAADGRLAPAVQRGLHRLAKPWHRRRALWIFRDQTGLAVTPKLWTSISDALDTSHYFVLLASPEAARSPWVNREIEHWLATKSADRILPVLTDGEWQWDSEAADFTAESTAVPAALRGVFAEEPLFLDLRWARDDLHLSLQHVRFRDAIAQLAAPMHGMSKDDLEGEDVRQHRRARRLSATAVAMLVLLTLVASMTGIFAVRNAGRANAAAAEAHQQQQVASQQRSTAERATQESARQTKNAEVQLDRAQAAKVETQRQTQLAQDQRVLAQEASDEAERQQTAAARFRISAQRQKADAERQQALAQGAGEEARRQRANADRQLANARRQQVLADQAAARAQQQKTLADGYRKAAAAAEQERKRQEKLAQAAAEESRRLQEASALRQRIEISTRLMGRAREMIGEDPAKALRLAVAAKRLHADAQTDQQLSHLVMSTHYAGTLGNVNAAVGLTGQVVATVDVAPTVSLWDTTDPSRPVRRASIPVAVTADTTMTAGPDGRTLAIFDGHAQADRWDVADPAHPKRLAPLTDEAGITAVTFSPDGHTAATSNRQHNTVLWDLTAATPAPLATLPAAYPMKFSPDGRTGVTSGDTVTVWDLADRAHPVATATLSLLYGDLPGAAIEFDPKLPVVAVEGDGDYVWLWDLSDPAHPRQGGSQLAANGDAHLSAMAFSPDGRTLALADSDGSTALWSVEDDDGWPWPSTLLATLTVPVGPVRSLAFSADGQTLTTAAGRHTATLWHTQGRFPPKPTATLAGPFFGRIVGLRFGPDSRSLIAAGRQGTAVPWDLTAPGGPARGAPVPLRDGKIDGISLSRDGRTLAVIGADNTVTLLDLTRPTTPAVLATIGGSGDSVSAVTFDRDARTVAVGSNDGSTTLWDLSVRQRPVKLADLALKEILSDIAFSPDGHTMAVAEGYYVSMWDVTDRTKPERLASIPLKDFVGYTANSLAFSPDGRTLAAGTYNASVLLWDVADPSQPRRIGTLTGHTNSVLWVGFSPDGRTLASASLDNAMMLWDVADPAGPIPFATIKTPDLQSFYAAFSPDGRTLAAGGTYGADSKSVTLWDATVPKALAADPARYACAISGRGLSTAEWAQYVPELPHQPTC